MSLQEHDREDLIAEATALRTRAEVRAPGFSEPVVLGLRDGGSLSVYFGADPVYHFDAAGALRRAFVDGVLYRSQGASLARLVRDRSVAGESRLIRTDLAPAALADFIVDMQTRLGRLAMDLDSQEARVLRLVEESAGALPRLRQALEHSRGGRLSAAVGRK